MVPNMTEVPRYKTVHPDTFVNSVQHRAGVEIKHTGWPGGKGISVAGAPAEPHLTPVNEAAQKIFDYHAKRRHQLGFPDSPIDHQTGRVYLPATFHAGPRGRQFPSITPPPNASAAMPRYEFRGYDTLFGHSTVTRGDVVVFLAWPHIEFMLTPVNATATAIASYYDENCDHPRLPSSPWNLYDDAPYLPLLPARARTAPAPDADHREPRIANAIRRRDAWATSR
jgi:hypothetical protein